MKKLKLILFLIVFSVFGHKTFGATITWNSGITGNWNVASNWTPAQVPGINDIAVFNATKLGSCVINANIDVGGISVQSGYTGTISQNSGIKIKIGSQNATFSAATFTGSSTTTDSIIVNGTFTLSGTNFTSTSGYLVFKNTVTYSSGTFNNNNGTVDFAATVSQTIPAWNYRNLTSSSTGTRTLASTGTIGISNSFTKGTNTFTNTGSTINFNGTGAQTITAFNYNNLTISGARTTNSITLASTGTIGIAGVFTNSATFTSGAYINTGSTVNYNGTVAQTVIAFNYNILTLSGARTSNNVTLVNGGTIRVASTFTNSATFTTGKIVSTNNTFEYNGSSSQTIGAIDYNNLVSSSTGARVLASIGVIGIAGTFTKGSNTYTITGSTVNYNGLGAQSIVAMNYNNLIISGSRGANNITLPNGGTIGIAKGFSPFATFTSGNYIVANSTIDYNGTGAQTISPFQYHNLISSSTGQRSFATTGSVKISGTFTKGTNTYTNLGLSGEGFSSIDVGVNTKYWCAPIANTTTVFIIGPAGFLLRSSNGGATWEQISVAGTTKDLRRIVFYDANNGLIGASAGLILKTTNGGSTWTAVQLSETENFSGVCYVNSSLVIATGGNSNCIIWRSTDGGSTWTKITNLTPATPRALYTTKFIDNLTGFAVGLNETLLKTTDGGLSWTLISNGTGWYHFSDIDITPNNTLFIVGNHLTNNDNRTYKSTDLGATLNIVNSSSVNWLGSIDFIDNNIGFAVGGSVSANTGVVYKTDNAGQTWSLYELGVSRIGVIRFADANSGYMYDLSGKVIKYSCCTEGGLVEFNGSVSQYVNGGSTTVKCNSLKINKSAGKVYINAPLQIQKNLTLTNGILVSSVSNTLEFGDNVDSVIATDNNYVAGPVKKIGNDAFTFPLGDTSLSSGALHPLKISAPSSTSDIYTASYSLVNQAYDPVIDTDSLESISNCETYTLVRNAGSSVVIPSISWNTNSCNADVSSDLRVAVWNTNRWESLGKSSIVFQGDRGYLSAAVGLNISSLSLTFGTAINKVLPPPICSNDINKNWLTSRNYDGNGNVIAESRIYSDYLGRSTQTQTKNLTESNVIASQVIYDVYGRQVLQTLSAPINQSEFCFKDVFITNSSGSAYSNSDFDVPNYTNNSTSITPGEVDKPKVVGNSAAGTLGWYYSDNNTLEPYVASSSFPYTRVLFDDNNGGELIRKASAGENLKMGDNHEAYIFTMPASGELRYIYGYANGWEVENVIEINDYVEFADGHVVSNYQPEIKAIKTITIDENGNETVSISDHEGKVLTTCLSGSVNGSNVQIQHVSSIIKPGVKGQDFVDIHLPLGCESSISLTNSGNAPPLAPISTITYNIFDLKKSKFVEFSGSIDFTGTNPVLPPGVYRIFYKSGAILTQLAVKYDLNYYNFSINYYDKAGRLTMTVPPKGVDISYNPNVTTTTVTNSKNLYYVASPTIPNPNWSLSNSSFDSNVSASITLPVNPEVQISNVQVTLSKIPVVIDTYNQQRSLSQMTVSPEPGGPSLIIGENTGVFDPFDPPPPPDGAITTITTYKVLFDVKNQNNDVIALDEEVFAYHTVTTGYMQNPVEAWSFGAPATSIVYPALGNTTSQINVIVKSVTALKNAVGGNYQTPYAVPLDIDLNQIKLSVFASTEKLPGIPVHTMPIVYDYDANNWLLSKQNADEGKTEYVYEKDGKLRFSQNSKQRASATNPLHRKFSYVNYDASNRITETGEFTPLPYADATNVFFENYYNYVPGAIYSGTQSVHKVIEDGTVISAFRCSDRKMISYDVADSDFYTLTGLSSANYKQEYVLYKVSKTWNNNKITWYSYDEQGRVKWMVQRIENMPTAGSYKIVTLNYVYDFNGNVLQVQYNKEVSSESFYHYYVYDSNNRLSKVYTNTDGTNVKKEQASYYYYLHGPLKRIELAGKTQGLDFVYTINGWLKSLNSPELNDRDPGKDGSVSSLNHVPKDIFGFTLDYFGNDYARSSTSVQTFDDPLKTTLSSNYYNGKVKGLRWQIATPSGGSGLSYTNTQLMYAYKYDKKYQLTDATFCTVYDNGTLNPVPGPPLPHDYYGPKVNESLDYLTSGITYDINGNLLTLNRNAYSSGGAQLMDQLNYNYYAGNNQLKNIVDAVAPNNYTTLNYNSGQTVSSSTYQYNTLGQLVDDASGSNYYNYDVYGRTTEVYWNALRTILKAKFVYDQSGQRLKKITYDGSGNLVKETWYVRDAAGNELSVYEKQGASSLQQIETGIYATDRIGIYYPQSNKNVYELADHIGNVRATFSQQVDYSLNIGFDGSKEDDYLVTYGNNVNTTVKRTGTSSIVVSPGAPISSTKIVIPVVNGQTVALSYYAFFNDFMTIGDGSFVFDLKDENGNLLNSTVLTNTLTTVGAWNLRTSNYTVSTGYSGGISLSIYPKRETSNAATFIYFDDLTITLSSNPQNIGILKTDQYSLADYYPHGGIMPGRNYVGSLNYRYGYQGQYSEKDEETNLNNFELRMWDGRIGRWLNPDPLEQYFSPYMGMSNNPVTTIDQNGGWDGDGWVEDGCNGYTYDSNPNIGKKTVKWEYPGGRMTYFGDEFGNLMAYAQLNTVEFTEIGYGKVPNMSPLEWARVASIGRPSSAWGYTATREENQKGALIVGGAAIVVVAAPVIIPAIAEAAPAFFSAISSEVNLLGGLRLSHLAGAGGGFFSTEALTATKLGGAFADATYQLSGNKPYNITSTIFQFNPFSNPIASAGFSGYFSEMLRFNLTESKEEKGKIGYQGIISDNFSYKSVFYGGTNSFVGNIIGGYPSLKLEPFKLGNSFDFIHGTIFNAGGNVLGNSLYEKK